MELLFGVFHSCVDLMHASGLTLLSVCQAESNAFAMFEFVGAYLGLVHEGVQVTIHDTPSP